MTSRLASLTRLARSSLSITVNPTPHLTSLSTQSYGPKPLSKTERQVVKKKKNNNNNRTTPSFVFFVSLDFLFESAKQMQPALGEGGAGRLSRFRSAPATWLEALLEDEEEEDPLRPSLCLTQLLTQTSSTDDNNAFATSSSSADLAKQNSLPADFGAHDAFFSGFGLGAPASFDLASQGTLDSSLAKRSRDLLAPIKLEQGGSGLIDMEMEKLLEDSVPCRVRAKRGCATHPRSIAERVRRTRISDRIRKLQELVPNMDKQTNTADMLDEAVEYVKHLRKQIEELSEHQRRCICTNK